ncbi:hypothetical protein L596_002750 [Steinernema carpocapsae]|uniref:E3 ubiquitin-protein ligase n=1 Tax=Steinernema carpocapsae TaxID=34508 RepID=A0A4U8UQL8_STECR|nr:hypothetical protein L596_002750 [Steinernema carpocapsae]
MLFRVDFNEECARWKVVADRLKNYYVPLWGAGFDSSIDEELKRDARELDAVLDECINADLENIDHSEKVWLLLNQGLDSREFDEKLRMYDFSNKCGAVWNTHSVAYRCMTCAKNPCMSLCENCYEEGGHRHHDSTRFFSLAGGACDCGSEDTLEKSGFCRRHGADAVAQAIEPPKDFLSLTEFVVVKLFIKLFLHYRTMIPDIENRYKEDKARMNRELIIRSLSEPCGVTDLLLEMINKGAAPRRSMVRILLDAELYARCHTPDGSSKNGACFHEGSTEDLRLAFETLPTLESVRTCVFRQECELFPSDDFREPSQCLQFDFRTMATFVLAGPPRLPAAANRPNTGAHVGYRDIFGHSIIRYYEQSIQHLANLYTLNLCDEANDLIARMIHVSVQICSMLERGGIEKAATRSERYSRNPQRRHPLLRAPHHFQVARFV